MRKSKRDIERRIEEKESNDEESKEVRILRELVDENGEFVETAKDETVEL